MIDKDEDKEKATNGEDLPKIILDQDAFYGSNPAAVQYAPALVCFGMWNFGIKYPKNSPPIPFFEGVYLNGFFALLTKKGFYKRYRSDGNYFLLHEIDNTIEEIEPTAISDFVTNYLIEEGEDIEFKLQIGAHDLTFAASLLLQKETIKKWTDSLFNKKKLEQLSNFEKEILKDTPTECFKLFKNGVYRITKEDYTILPYADLKKFVWRKHIIDFEFEYENEYKDSHFYNFIYNVSDGKNDLDRHKAFISAMGYALHNYNNPEKGQAVLCYDEVITDLFKPEGGTGKGIFFQALSEFSELVKIDGKKFDGNERFCFQRVKESTQIVVFDDVKTKAGKGREGFGFDRFNSILTDGWDIEKKNKDEFAIKAVDSPKVVITSNSILECEGSTRKRRQFILEFSNFYSKNIEQGSEQPIKDHHGCTFFSADWDKNEWQKFYSFMLNSVFNYMELGLHYYKPKNVIINRLRQETNEDFASWIYEKKLEINKEYESKPLFMEFKENYYGIEDKFSQRRFTLFLKKYASLNDYILIQPPASHGITTFKIRTK